MPRINTNVSALQTQNMLNDINGRFSQSVQRLSSGFRINSASDDAAGLGIANRLKADIGALKQSSRNAEQADSLLQVAEGGAQNVENILERMKTLATQAASDNVNDDDRALIQDEFSNLQDEIGRIVDTTKFQGSKLLDGSFGASVEAGDNRDGNVTATGTETDVDDADAFGDDVLNERTGFTDDAGSNGDYGITDVEFGQSGNFRISTTASAGATGTVKFTATKSGGDVSEEFEFTSVGSTSASAEVELEAFDLEISVDNQNEFLEEAADSSTGTGIEIDVKKGDGTFLVSGNADAGPSGAGTINISGSELDLTTDTLGQNSSGSEAIADQSLSTRSDAETAIESIDRAITDVSESMGTIGASMNRIGFAKSNTETAIENFSAAESVIRDVDIASETTRFSRLQIQQQAATSMLAQANSAPQQVLGLIQG